MSSLALFMDEDYGGDDSGHDFSLFDDGCFDPTLFDDPFIPQLSLEFLFLIFAKISQHFENHQNQSSDHLRFEPLGGAGRTLRRETKRHESVSVTTTTTTPTAIDLLSKIIAFKLIRQVSVSVPKAISNYLLNIPSIEFNNDWGDYTNPTTLVSDDEDDLEEDTTTDDDDYYYGDDCVYRSLRSSHGLPLVEVFSVVIKENKNKNVEKKPGGGGGGGVLSSVWGTIRVEGGCGSEYIYYTKREDSESISLSGGGKTALLLTGPSRIFQAFDTVTIEVALMDRRNLSLDDYDDDVFCRGTIYWDFITGSSGNYENEKFSSGIRYNPRTMFDKPLATKLHGRSGSVTINYLMWLDGVTATVEVTLLNSDGVNVYGLIRAGNTCGVFNYWSVLFSKKKESEESIDVRCGQLIPLSRSIVAVNRITSLKVSAKLYVRRDRDLSQDDEDDDEIVNGTVEFPAQNSGTSEKDISGWHGEIRVKVTWKDW